jgi:hypothetical protein
MTLEAVDSCIFSLNTERIEGKKLKGKSKK